MRRQFVLAMATASLSGLILDAAAQALVSNSNNGLTVSGNGQVIKKPVCKNKEGQAYEPYPWDNIKGDWGKLAAGDTSIKWNIHLSMVHNANGKSETLNLYNDWLPAGQTTFEFEYGAFGEHAAHIAGDTVSMPNEWVDIGFYVANPDGSKQAHVDIKPINCVRPP